ncbi:MAG: HAD family hydrolase [Theionarchaea archaeon]|nr:HAD family hydrolase [Theionarchaea archaeon]MBU7037554.1 HAD family hydrolase [Theionarchaea archaeon]
MLKAVIFDLDGTLTDCDLGMAKRRVCDQLVACGAGHEETVRRMEEIHYRFNVEGVYDRNQWWEEFDIDLTSSQKQHLTDLYWDSVTSTTFIKPYAESLLASLKSQVKLVLLTDYDGESHSKKRRINSLPLLHYFDLIVVAGEDTEQCKPSPEPYSFVLKKLNFPPATVLMVGDKPQVDLEGARALGLPTLLVEGEYGQYNPHVSSLEEAHQYIETLLTSPCGL